LAVLDERALVDQQAPRIAALVSGISDDLCEVIDTCLSRQPARRYLDGAELKAALDGFEAAR
jgi:serine/threonine-protein kinase